MKPFENTKIRCLQVGNTNKWYFSTVDICAAIRGTNYSSARNYWKWLKSKLAKNNSESSANSTNAPSNSQLVSATNQLKLPCADGKLRYTDVMDVDEVLSLIQQIPSPKALKFRLWLLSQLKAGKNLAKIAKTLTSCMVTQDFAREIKNAVVTALGTVVLLKTVKKHEFIL